MTVWHKRGELPHGFIEENKLFVYVFDDGVDVTEYCEQYHKCSNLKKWCVFNELCGLEKRLNRIQELEAIATKKLDIAIKALEEYTTFCRHPAEEALKDIKQIGE